MAERRVISEYVVKIGGDLFYEDRLKVLQWIMLKGYKIHEHRDGSRVNLDKFTLDDLTELKDLVDRLNKVKPEDLI